MQYIGVIDGNNFFVSCERLFRPDLVGKPVLVLSSNDGCVVARSQEVKDMGITMGVPYFQIKDIAEKARTTSFSSHFTLYRDISSRVFTLVEKLQPRFEQYSIDEAFFVVTADSKTVAEAEMRLLKATVEREIGIPVSIGLAATKTQAKYANRLAKKAGGVTVLDPADWAALAPTIKLQSIWGVGGRLSARYRAAKMETVADVINCPTPRLDTLFGIAGKRLQAEFRGEIMYPVSSKKVAQKSIISSRSFKQATTNLMVIKDAVAYHVRQAAADLRRFGVMTSYLAVLISPSRHGDYHLRGGTQSVLLPHPTNDTAVLLKAAMDLVETLFEAEVPFKKAGVMFGQFVPVDFVQPSLFMSTNQAAADDRLMKTIDTLHARFGRELVQLGRHANLEWQSRHEKLSPAYTTRWSEIATVKA